MGVADGLSKAGIDERAVAVFGDSSFFHSSLPAICNAVHHRSDILMIVLDNQATATSGFQPNPGVPKDALGKEAPAVSIEKLATACGVKTVHTVDLDDPDSKIKAVFTEALTRRELTMVIVKINSDK